MPRITRTALTVDRIRRFKCPAGKAQVFHWDSGAPGLGVRVTAGSKSYVFQSKLENATIRLTIGDTKTWPLESVWSGRGKGRRETKRGAREEARRLQGLVDQDLDPRQVAADLAAARTAEVARKKAEEAKAVADAEYTLRNLMSVYVAHLRKQGKSSAGAVENCVLNHVTIAKPEIANKPAEAVTWRDIVALLRPLTEAGKGRQAGKLRAYLRAAFALAARAEVDANAPAAFLPFKVEGNPVVATGTLAEFNKALDRALTEPELREYYQALKDQPDSPIRDALLLALLLGGQRCAQVLRATVTDADVTARTLRLLDPKGKRNQARVHVLPLTDEALVVVKRCITRAKQKDSTWLFSISGKTQLSPETVTKEATNIAETLLGLPEDERVIGEEFRLRDIRRTCETRLAEMGISRDLRAQIQSHGLGGIQSKHYDRHDYMVEKRAALTAWEAFLEMKPADNVRQLHEVKTAT
jgi:integrase